MSSFMRNFSWTTLIVTMVALYVGTLISLFIIPVIPWPIYGLLQALLVGVIQMSILMVLGLLTGKTSIWTILIGGFIIIVSGMVGGYIADVVTASHHIPNAIIIVGVQTLALMVFGFVGKGK
jgi:hypothetical protein